MAEPEELDLENTGINVMTSNHDSWNRTEQNNSPGTNATSQSCCCWHTNQNLRIDKGVTGQFTCFETMDPRDLVVEEEDTE